MQIPADMVVNAMMVAMVAHANQIATAESNNIIYQVGSSVSNPINLTYIQDCGRLYFTKHPWIGNDGKPVKVGKITVLNSMASFHRYMTIHYLLPLKVCFCFCFCFGVCFTNHLCTMFRLEIQSRKRKEKGEGDRSNGSELTLIFQYSFLSTKSFLNHWSEYNLNFFVVLRNINTDLVLFLLFPILFQGLKMVNIAFCQHFRAMYYELHRKINFVMRLIDLYRPYLFFKGM